MGRLLHDPDVAKHSFPTHELLNLRHHRARSVIVFVRLFELLMNRHVHAAELPKSLNSYGPLQLTKQRPFHVRERTGRGERGRDLRQDGRHDIDTWGNKTELCRQGRECGMSRGGIATDRLRAMRCSCGCVSGCVLCCVSVLTVRVEQNMRQIALCSSSENEHRAICSMFVSRQKHRAICYMLKNVPRKDDILT